MNLLKPSRNELGFVNNLLEIPGGNFDIFFNIPGGIFLVWFV